MTCKTKPTRFADSVDERSACGVGFIANLNNLASHATVASGLSALECVEHRGACAADGETGDGAGIMTDIPFELLGHRPDEVAVATIFLNTDPARKRRALNIFRETFGFLGLPVIDMRVVPVDTGVLGPLARQSRPDILWAVIGRPAPIRTPEAFNTALYLAKQHTVYRLKLQDALGDLSFTSLSMRTVVYKALTTSQTLGRFYLDLQDPRFRSRFCLFHRRFSTNTRSSWDRAQPFRLIAHNGEINTIAGNRSWAYAREQALGLWRDQLLTKDNTSDSGNLNQMAEAMKHRSSMAHLEDILAIMIPPADTESGFYQFWGRAVEPWDGPAFVTYSDGESVGARLDRNGFRPCRWLRTDDHFYLASEAGLFAVAPEDIRSKGTLNAGSGVLVDLSSGEVHFRDPSRSRENEQAVFEPRLVTLPDEQTLQRPPAADLGRLGLFGVSEDEVDSILVPLLRDGREPIGSMGDTARLAIFSSENRSLFDFMFQDFAQVTNPPLDYLREKIVTDLTTHLGKKPNVFSPKELIPPTPGFVLSTPLLGRSQMHFLKGLESRRASPAWLSSVVVDATFAAAQGPGGLGAALDQIGEEALAAAAAGATLLIISDRAASPERPPVPSILALRASVNALNRGGLRLDTSIAVEAGDVRSTHHFACLIGYGASAVCPYLVFDIAEALSHRQLDDVDAETRKAHLRQAMESGLLKVMSKVGISVLRSYQSSKLFTPLGLGDDVVGLFFSGRQSVLGGLSLDDLGAKILRRVEEARASKGLLLPKLHRLKEHARGLRGEIHSMTSRRARLVHAIVDGQNTSQEQDDRYQSYLDSTKADAPYSFVDLLEPGISSSAEAVDAESEEAILARFGSGAMSFGALSAEAQRDIFVAMRRIGARCNSGEGGENPYYAIDGTCATTKQVASARFGVTAEYLVTGREIEIKMAQGAKPGEGGQLMGVKVDEAIALARHATVGVSLISPPPLHDIYSIEDLKQLIYELRQLHPGADIVVKLVSGSRIGSIAAGCVKAGADVLQISGGCGGTGAAPLSSMMHAGLPWEVGLVEAHQALISHELRHDVKLRVDGGLQRGRDVVVAALLGADEFGFGKSLLVAQGCIMARICEKNRCPRGLTTHDPKFKAKYQGSPEAIELFLRLIAREIQGYLRQLGVQSLEEIIGRTDWLRVPKDSQEIADQRGLRLGYFIHGSHYRAQPRAPTPFRAPVSSLNAKIVQSVIPALAEEREVQLDYNIASTDRAVLTRLAGLLGERKARLRRESREGTWQGSLDLPEGRIQVKMRGSAGQGFAAFLGAGVSVTLAGEANDSLAKGMSGGYLVLLPPAGVGYDPCINVIAGNCALYGATGGRLYVHGVVGDRFAVRNSGAVAVVEGAGLHLCEYMTRGTVLVLGSVGPNVGAGMTGGKIILASHQRDQLNTDYVAAASPSPDEADELRVLLTDYAEATGSQTARAALDQDDLQRDWTVVVPLEASSETQVPAPATTAQGNRPI